MDTVLALQVRLVVWAGERRHAAVEWLRRDDGQEAGVEKLILIGAAIAIAVAAAAVFVAKFGDAKNNVDTPTKITVP
jgi:hypothetical protein